MGDLDIAAKVLLRQEASAFVSLAFPGRKIRSVAPDETELQALERRLDKLFCIEVEGEPGRSWVNFEVEAAWAADVPSSTFDHWSLTFRERRPLRSMVLVLRPGDRQGEPRGEFVVPDVLSFKFDVLCAWPLSAQDLLEARDPPLLPLVPFAEGANPARVEEALRILGQVPKPRRIELQAVLVTFAGWVFPEVPWMATIPEEIFMESTVLKEIRAAGRAEGRIEGHANALADLLRHRLGESEVVESLVKRLSACSAATLRQISFLIMDESKENLVPAVERLLPKE